MSDSIGSAADISLSIYDRATLTHSAARSLNQTASATGDVESDDAKAQEAANKFEELLIHNMLKSMRKTTMSENKSNSQAIYDDMLDEKLANTMMKAGGIGIADQIVSQIKKQRGTDTTETQPTSDAERLRKLSSQIQRPASVDSSGASGAHSDSTATLLSQSQPTSSATTSIGHIRWAANLWSDKQVSQMSQRQHEFVKPLMPHAERSAQRLGTSPAAIIAIAALETGWGRSNITDERGADSHNLFGIKATGSDNSYATTLTTEYIDGSPQKMQARFKTYSDDADAVDGFADFILSNPRYSNALQHAGDPERFLKELQDAGYATDPRYAEKAISIMRQIARNPLPL